MQIVKNTVITLIETFIVVIILIAVFALLLQSAPESSNYSLGVSVFSKITAMGWPLIIGIILQNKVKDVKKTAFFVFLIALLLMLIACFIVPSSKVDGFNLLFLVVSYVAAAVGACLNNLFRDTVVKYIKKFAKH